jgi:hypothetical protein
VLQDANRPEDVTGYLDRNTLVAVWPEVSLPEGVRQAREGVPPAAARRVTRDGLMQVSDLHRRIAALALAAAGEHGFALGGGNALLAHGPSHGAPRTPACSPARSTASRLLPVPWRPAQITSEHRRGRGPTRAVVAGVDVRSGRIG